MKQGDITRFGSRIIAVLNKAIVYKPKKKQYTSILSFEVIKPQHDIETVGEVLELSSFGEYCPEASMRGYSLEELLIKTDHYRPKVIVQMGEVLELKHN